MNTPSGKATSSSCRLLRVTPASRSQPVGPRAARAAGGSRRRTGSAAVCDASTCGEPVGRAAVEDLAAVLARAPGPTSTIQSAWRITSSSCSTTNSELPDAFSRSSAAQQRLGVGRVQPGRRLVEHVDDAEQVGAHLRRQPQPLQLAGRERRRAALEREVAEPEVEQDGEPRHRGPRRSAGRRSPSPGARARSVCQPRRRAVGVRAASSSASRVSGSRDISAMSSPANVTDSASRPQPLAVAGRALGAHHVARHALLHQRRSRVVANVCST